MSPLPDRLGPALMIATQVVVCAGIMFASAMMGGSQEDAEVIDPAPAPTHAHARA